MWKITAWTYHGAEYRRVSATFRHKKSIITRGILFGVNCVPGERIERGSETNDNEGITLQE